LSWEEYSKKLRDASILLKDYVEGMLERVEGDERLYVKNMCGVGKHFSKTEPFFGEASYMYSIGKSLSEEECFDFF